MGAFGYTRREIDHPNGKVQLGFLLGSDNTRYFLADDFWMQLAWVSIDNPGVGNFRLGSASTSLDGSIDNVIVQDTTIPTLASCAFFDLTNPVTGTEYEATDGDDLSLGMGFHIINITAPDPLSGNVKIYLRYLDADNYLSVEFNDAGDVLFRERVAGVNLDASNATKITAGASVTLYVHLTEYFCDIYARIGNAFVTDAWALNRWIPINAMWQNFAEATVKVQSASAYSVTRWRAWPLVSRKYGQISIPRIGKSFMSIGDSKTLGYEWQGPMLTALNALAVHQWKEFPGAISAGGWTVALCQAAIDAAITARYSYPDHILINLGSNDVSALPAEATWKANYSYIIEALHVAYPNAKIYLAKPVLLNAVPPSTPVADCATMWGWIDDLIASYSYVYEGIDETDLEGGDGYATNLTDTTHYAAAGFTAVAALWQAALDYPKRLPLFFDIRGVHDAALDFVTPMSALWKANDFVSCKGAITTGDVSPLDDVTFPCKKVATSTVTRSDIAIADLVAEALAHGCEYVCLNYEGITANDALTYWEADQPVVVAAGLKCICAPIRSVLENIMSNAVTAARMLAVTDRIFIQAQTIQTSPDDG